MQPEHANVILVQLPERKGVGNAVKPFVQRMVGSVRHHVEPGAHRCLPDGDGRTERRKRADLRFVRHQDGLLVDDAHVRLRNQIAHAVEHAVEAVAAFRQARRLVKLLVDEIVADRHNPNAHVRPFEGKRKPQAGWSRKQNTVPLPRDTMGTHAEGRAAAHWRIATPRRPDTAIRPSRYRGTPSDRRCS